MFFVLSTAIVLEAKGKDCLRYLNSRLSNDLRSTTRSKACLAAALTPQARTQALFLILRLADDKFLMICDGGEKQQIVAAVKKYIVADRIEIQEINQYTFVHLFGEDSDKYLSKLGLEIPVAGEYAVSEHAGSFAIRHARTQQAGYDLLLRNDLVTQTLTTLKVNNCQEAEAQYFRVLRFRAGSPSFPDEINERSLLLEAGLKDVISENKGCYVGQEVNERILSHGKVPRRLELISQPGKVELTLGMTLSNPIDKQHVLGELVSFVFDQEQNETLCFIYKRHHSAPS